MSIITTEIHNVDTEPMLDSAAMCLLFGVRDADITSLPVINGAVRIPQEWLKRGLRRSKEATAATGSDFILDILQFWAQHDHGADLEVVYR